MLTSPESYYEMEIKGKTDYSAVPVPLRPLSGTTHSVPDATQLIIFMSGLGTTSIK